MSRSNNAQKRILLLAVLSFVGFVVYLKTLSLSVRKDIARMQTADEQLYHSPKREASARRIEDFHRLQQAISLDEPQEVARFLHPGLTGNTIIGTQSICGFAASRGAVRVMSLLLSKGTDINAYDRTGNTPLLEAAKDDQQAMVDLLLAHGANVNATGIDRATALLYATGNNRLSMAQSLVKHGASVNIQPKGVQSPMLMATVHANVDMLHLLLAHGGDPNEKSNFYPGLLRYARQHSAGNSKSKFVDALIQAGAKE